MLKTKKEIVTKIHLIISVLVVGTASIIYGFYPNSLVELFPTTIDALNFNKAIMGLYLGFSILWLLGIFKVSYLKVALISNVVFMFGLAFGRLVSISLDGIPSLAYVLGTFGELILGLYSLYIYNRCLHSKK